MSEEGKHILRSTQCARIILCISEMFGVSLDEATDIYYSSETANLIEEGVADLHCRSDKYLAEEVWREHQEKGWTKSFAGLWKDDRTDKEIIDDIRAARNANIKEK